MEERDDDVEGGWKKPKIRIERKKKGGWKEGKKSP